MVLFQLKNHCTPFPPGRNICDRYIFHILSPSNGGGAIILEKSVSWKLSKGESSSSLLIRCCFPRVLWVNTSDSQSVCHVPSGATAKSQGHSRNVPAGLSFRLSSAPPSWIMLLLFNPAPPSHRILLKDGLLYFLQHLVSPSGTGSIFLIYGPVQTICELFC